MNRVMVAAISCLISAAALFFTSPAFSDALGRDTSPWSWLGAHGGTYWYVPTENLQAIKWDTSAPSAYASIRDQTVWHIANFDNGYFFGPLVVQFEGYPRLCQYMVGSVTPEGRVYISFNSVQVVPVGNPSITTGTGAMVWQRGGWTFNMQMASGSSSTQVAHWAFMHQCTADQPCWKHLPGTTQSLAEFLAECGYN